MKRTAILLLLIIGLCGLAYFLIIGPSDSTVESTPQYEFSKVERKTVLNMVSATGTIAARDIVEVGTQVSGRLAEVIADFNDEVTAGELIAVIDPSVLDATVKMEKADLMRMQAQLQQAKNKYERFKPVHEGGFLSDDDFEPYLIALQIAEANVLSAEAALDRASQNREYAEIRTPISGVVIDRTVEPGQTVAANFNAPRLFTIANDLSKMEILANVDESDIGQIKAGQEVRFTVAAYLDETFVGVVVEIRLLPRVIQNVVNYTVVVTADNPGGQLLPGMTATLDFVIEEVEDALSVTASALSLRPNEDMVAVMLERRTQRRKQREANGGEMPDGGGRPGAGGFSGPGGGGRPSAGPGNFGGVGGRPGIGMLWYLEDGEIQLMPVRTGVSDGVRTEVIPLRDATIEEGFEVISKVNTPATGGTQSQSPGGRPSGLRRLGF